MLDVLARRVPVRNPRALSRTIMEMVAAGEIKPQARMPTVREVARALGMSPTGVAAAWRELVDWRVLETRRRGGTTVRGPARAPRASRYDVMMRASEGIPLNLGHLTPDPAILPRLDRAFAAALAGGDVNGPDTPPVTAGLRAAMAAAWPFAPEGMMATPGGIAAAQLVLEATVRPGDRVAVDSPTVSRVLDILDAIGARPLPVTLGAGGPDLALLRRALAERPAAFVYQPSGAFPGGQSVTEDWIAAAAPPLALAGIPVIELVQAPLMARRPPLSLGRLLPRRVVHIQAFNFFTGPDLRVGVAGGSGELVDRMWQRLTFSSGWVSRILQNALAFQLTDRRAREEVDAYVATCRQRHQAMVAALRSEGFALPDGDGPAIWLPVGDEYVVTHRLSGRGIVVHAGSYFGPTADGGAHVLLNGTRLAGGQAGIARLLGAAAAAGPPSAAAGRGVS